jgi:hypothetical protein
MPEKHDALIPRISQQGIDRAVRVAMKHAPGTDESDLAASILELSVALQRMREALAKLGFASLAES